MCLQIGHYKILSVVSESQLLDVRNYDFFLKKLNKLQFLIFFSWSQKM